MKWKNPKKKVNNRKAAACELKVNEKQKKAREINPTRPKNYRLSTDGMVGYMVGGRRKYKNVKNTNYEDQIEKKKKKTDIVAASYKS